MGNSAATNQNAVQHPVFHNLVRRVLLPEAWAAAPVHADASVVEARDYVVLEVL